MTQINLQTPILLIQIKWPTKTTYRIRNKSIPIAFNNRVPTQYTIVINQRNKYRKHASYLKERKNSVRVITDVEFITNSTNKAYILSCLFLIIHIFIDCHPLHLLLSISLDLTYELAINYILVHIKSGIWLIYVFERKGRLPHDLLKPIDMFLNYATFKVLQLNFQTIMLLL